MKNRIKILAVFCLLLIIGGGCANSQKITQPDIKEITKNSSSLTPKEGPFANIKFIFYTPNQTGYNLRLTNSNSENGDLVFELLSLSMETNLIMQATTIQKSLKQILSEISTSTYRKVYSHTFNNEIIDEVRCFDTKSICERYLALDPNRSVVITDYYSLRLQDSIHTPFYALFNFEFEPKKPEMGEWELVRNLEEFSFSLYHPKSLPWEVIEHTRRTITIFPQNMSSSLEQSAIYVEVLKQEADRLITNQKLASSVPLISHEELVNGISVTGLCSKNNTPCTYYFSRPGQETIRVTEFTNQQVYKTLQFKRYYPYDPLEILNDNK